MARLLHLIPFAIAALGSTAAVAQDPRPQAPPTQSPSLTATAPVTSPAPALTKADVEAWLDGFLPYALVRGDVAGAVVVVVKDGQILAQKGYGYADVAKRTPVDAERTLFRSGSVGKLFTWTAVMQLVEQGKLDLDRDVNDYLDFKIAPRDGKPITMRTGSVPVSIAEAILEPMSVTFSSSIISAREHHGCLYVASHGWLLLDRCEPPPHRSSCSIGVAALNEWVGPRGHAGLAWESWPS